MPQLASKAFCTGCTACGAVCPKNCIAMETDSEGFAYPVVDESTCVGCGLCEKTCPVLHAPAVETGGTEAYALFSTDEALRAESSSGGAFSLLALDVLAQGGAVFGAAYDEQFDVHHICVEEAASLAKLRGAKYAQSRLGDAFQQVKTRLDQGQQVLFSGTPCQVAGLKAFLRRDYPNLLTVDFVCHGVPSPMAWRKYVRYRANTDNSGQLPQQINLRDKRTGWSRYRYSNVFSYYGGHQHSCQNGESLFMRLFVGDYINRRSCAQCAFKGFLRPSDVTLGDFWGIWNIAPEMDDDKGTSLLLLHTEKARQAFAAIQGKIVCKPVTLEQASQENKSLLVSSPSRPQREAVLELLKTEQFEALEKQFPKAAPGKRSFLSRVKSKIKRIITK